MKRALFLAVPVLVLAAAIVAIASAMLSFPAGAQQTLDSYLHYSRVGAPPDERQAFDVSAIARASRPWALNRELSYITVGDNSYFRTDRTFSVRTPAATPVSGNYLLYSDAGTQDQGAELPLPPEEAWCAILEGEHTSRVILIARHHQEPYITEWIIHQGPLEPFSQQTLNTLLVLGCDLGMSAR